MNDVSIHENDSSGLKKVLNVRDLTLMGIAAVMGAGIFSTIGSAAFNGGPGVILLFVITAVTCGFTALCYAEFASRIPVSGSAYTYSYVSFGEVVAWIIGWALILEYAIGNIVVAISVLITLLVYIGIKESKRTANAMVILKIIMLLVIAAIGLWFIFSNNTMHNWTPFLPNGMGGVLKGVSAVFFAYIGFDAISTTAEECADPKRDLPRGMIYSLIICTIIYIVTALVITGMVNYAEFENVTDPLAYVFDKINLKKIGFVISIGAVVAATSVLLVFQLGQPRIWMAMSRDGLLPPTFSRINEKFKTPGFSTLISGILVGGLVLFIDDKLMTDLTSIGTLFAFVLVSGGVLLLPRIERQEGKFSIPYINSKFIFPILYLTILFIFRDRTLEAVQFITTEGYQEILFLLFILLSGFLAVGCFIKSYSLIPVLGVACCLYLMVEIPAKSWIVFLGWMSFGLLIYFSYGIRNSKLNQPELK